MPTISLCMIVRDEEKTLESCLSSVVGIPDEIIIVDTGSTDGTKEIAGRFTRQVFDFEWIDDFAAARNYSFDQASMDYIMWLDSDDVLLPEDRAKLLELKDTLSSDIDAVSMNYHIAFDKSGNVTSSARRFRLVRRTKNFVWSGVVHEDLAPAGDYRYLNSDITVTHQKPDIESGPSTRNRNILEKFFSEGGEPRPADLFNYARELQANKDFDKAIVYYNKFLDTKTAERDVALFTLNSLATCYYMVGRRDKEWECTLKSLELDIPRPEFSCRFGERFLGENRYQQAIFWYELALRNPAGPNDRVVSNQPFSTWLPHKQLALCFYQLGDHRRSLHHNRLAREFVPHDPEVQANIKFLESQLNETGE